MSVRGADGTGTEHRIGFARHGASTWTGLRYAGRTKECFVSFFPADTGEKGRDYTALVKYVGRMPTMRMMGGRTELSMQLAFEET